MTIDTAEMYNYLYTIADPIAKPLTHFTLKSTNVFLNIFFVKFELSNYLKQHFWKKHYIFLLFQVFVGHKRILFILYSEADYVSENIVYVCKVNF